MASVSSWFPTAQINQLNQITRFIKKRVIFFDWY